MVEAAAALAGLGPAGRRDAFVRRRALAAVPGLAVADAAGVTLTSARAADRRPRPAAHSVPHSGDDGAPRGQHRRESRLLRRLHLLLHQPLLRRPVALAGAQSRERGGRDGGVAGRTVRQAALLLRRPQLLRPGAARPGARADPRRADCRALRRTGDPLRGRGARQRHRRRGDRRPGAGGPGRDPHRARERLGRHSAPPAEAHHCRAEPARSPHPPLQRGRAQRRFLDVRASEHAGRRAGQPGLPDARSGCSNG